MKFSEYNMIDTHHNPLCIHTQQENGIHEFILTKASRSAIDEFINQTGNAYRNEIQLEPDFYPVLFTDGVSKIG